MSTGLSMDKASKNPDDFQDLSKSRTVPIVISSSLSPEAIFKALESLNLPSSYPDSSVKQSAENEDNSLDSADEYIGKVIDGKYKILSLLGQGGMGAVYLAHHISLNKDVALKTFHERNLTDDNRQRFQREAQSIGRLQHKNIVQVFDYGITESGAPYYTMEVLEGENVADRIERKGPLKPEEALTIFRGLCDGLSICHQRKIVHRDVKPSNIFLELRSDSDDTVQKIKLVDFGIAALVNDDAEEQRLTAIGTVFGSPLYMSPEQSMGAQVDSRSDIYSAGCALFEMLTGRPPYCASSAFATMLCHQQAEIPTLASVANRKTNKNSSRAENDTERDTEGYAERPTESSKLLRYPEWLEGLIASMLAKNPAERVQTLEEVLDVIDYNKHSLHAVPYDANRSQSAGGKVKQKVKQKQSGSRPAISGGAIAFLAIAMVALSVTAFIVMLKDQTKSAPIGGEAKIKDITQLRIEGPKEPPLTVNTFRLADRGDGKIHYLFPHETIGLIGQGDENIRVNAKGEVSIPAGPNVFFIANDRLIEHPELLLGFGKDDLRTLTLLDTGVGPKTDQRTTKYMRHLKSLKKFSASNSDIGLASIDDLNQLPELDDLLVDGTALTGNDLVKLRRLSEISFLTMSGMNDCTPVFEALAKHSKISHLTADGCNLTDDDFRIICKIPTLTQLYIGGNNVSDKSIAAILNLPHLEFLRLTGNPITPASLPVFLKMNKVKLVYMPHNFWNSTTRKAFHDTFGANTVKNVWIDNPLKHVNW